MESQDTSQPPSSSAARQQTPDAGRPRPAGALSLRMVLGITMSFCAVVSLWQARPATSSSMIMGRKATPMEVKDYVSFLEGSVNPDNQAIYRAAVKEAAEDRAHVHRWSMVSNWFIGLGLLTLIPWKKHLPQKRSGN